MNNLTKFLIVAVLLSAVTACSQILQNVELKINSEDDSIQEEFNVIEKTLTLNEAKSQNKSTYNRLILKPGKGNDARNISENSILKSKFPDKQKSSEYKIGIGDTLSFSRLIENNHSYPKANNQWPKNPKISNYILGIGDTLALTLLKEGEVNNILPNDGSEDGPFILESQSDLIVETKGRIGSDGSVLLLEVGRLEAQGKSLNELQSDVRNILIRNGVSPRFQLEIVDFASQRAYFTANGTSDVIVLRDQKSTLRDILTESGLGFEPGVTAHVRLQREGTEYRMTLRSIFSADAPDITIADRDHIFVENSTSNIIPSSSIVGSNGHVVLPGVGSIKAAGLSISQIRNKIFDLIDKFPDSENAFQIKVTEFNSQKAFVNIPGKNVGSIVITDKKQGLDEILTGNGLSVDDGKINQIKLKRQGKTYYFTLDQLINQTSEPLFIQPNDRITIETLSYKDNKVFVLGAVDPKIVNINPTNRETLADILFTSGGALSSASAKRSEVYLLRGTNPVTAYHLNAQSPTRLIVADAMELRPNDILYVAEQPIISFNRTLATIVPLRILLRDLQDENIP